MHFPVSLAANWKLTSKLPSQHFLLVQLLFTLEWGGGGETGCTSELWHCRNTQQSEQTFLPTSFPGPILSVCVWGGGGGGGGTVPCFQYLRGLQLLFPVPA